MNTQLRSFHIIQKNHSNKNLITWTFPSISNEYKSTLLKKVFTLPGPNTFNCIRFIEWFYIREFEIKAKRMAVAVITSDYDPSKYETLCNILINNYEKNENPVELVKLYLTVFTQGTLSIQENGILMSYNFSKFNSPTNVKEMIKAFGLEIILIYNSLLLKKRMLVYHPNLKKLQKALLTISKLMLHRDLNDYLFPHVDDMSDAKGKMFFVAGCTNSRTSLGAEFYDLYINMPSRQITISPHAKETFAMNKKHKEVAMFIVQLAENQDISEEQVILQINVKTQEMLSNLRSLATSKTAENKQVITLEALRGKNLNPITENFLFNLAVAENIMML